MREQCRVQAKEPDFTSAERDTAAPGGVVTRLDAFLAMGGYASFVWPAYAAAAIVLGGLLMWSFAGYRRAQRELEALQRTSPDARRP